MVFWSFNGPFAAGGHMVKKKTPYSRANCALGFLNKAIKFKFSLFCMSQCAVYSMAVFVPCDCQLERVHLVLVLFVIR